MTTPIEAIDAYLERNATEQVFAFVDKAARQKLRSHVRS